jgi:hypothetical protein
MDLEDLQKEVRRIRSSIKRWWQRRTRGWDDSDTWSLDYTIAKFALPRLIRFKELNNGYPGDFATPEAWDEAIDKMIYSLQACIKHNEGNDIDIADWPRVKEGLELFGKHFMALWW